MFCHNFLSVLKNLWDFFFLNLMLNLLVGKDFRKTIPNLLYQIRRRIPLSHFHSCFRQSLH